MSSAIFERYYREIFTDLTVTDEESDEIKDMIRETNPPPDKLLWLRSTSFRIGTEFITTDDDDDDKARNISLLKAINAIVHAIETTTMAHTAEGSEDDFDEAEVEDFYREIYSDLAVDREESQELLDFFKEKNVPPKDKSIWTRAAAFRIAVEFLSDEKAENVQLFRCINSIVDAFERSCMTPKPYNLKKEKMNVDVSLPEALQTIWDLDVNRLTPGEDYTIDVQGGKKPFWKDDAARDPLFTFVNTKEFRRKTYHTFIALLDNYTSEVGVSEKVTHKERGENQRFLDAIMQTAPMQFCHAYCVEHGDDVPKSKQGFMKLLDDIWFDLYYRDRSAGRDSSGFEHVFVGEIKNDQVSGFHNWIRFYLEEKRGDVDYRGYIKPKSYSDAPTDDNDHVLTLQFNWNGVPKKVGTSFVGVSPEFEMALYTMCFLVGEKENIFDIDTGTDLFKLNCKVYHMGKDKIGTSYVEALEHED